MFTIRDPVPGSRGVFAGGNRRRMAHQGDELALALDLEAQNAITVLFVVEGDALDQPSEVVKCSGEGS